MGTYCAIHVKTSDEERLVAELERYVAENHRGRVVQRVTAETMGNLYGNEFLVSMDLPTKFAAVVEQPGWITVFYNSFNRVRDLEVDISKQFQSEVITVTAQSCSSAYYFSVSSGGKHLRALECADGEWSLKEGNLLPFETEPIGTNLSDEDEEPWYVFDSDSVTEYCANFGLKLWTHEWMKMATPHLTIISALPAKVLSPPD
jgi:hypothetical protein